MSSAIDDTKPDLEIDPSTQSPVERRQSLEKHLQTRPDAQDLKNRHILLDTNAAPTLQSVQQELERHQATDSLKKHLESRPERDELVDKNILPDSNAAPGLQAQQKALEKQMKVDHLEQGIKKRPTAEQLAAEGILK